GSCSAASTSLGMAAISCFDPQNYLHRCWQVVGLPIRHASRGVRLKSGSHPDGAHPRIVSALDIDLAIADEKRTGKIDLVFSGGVDDHSGRRFAMRGMWAGNIWTKISRVD